MEQKRKFSKNTLLRLCGFITYNSKGAFLISVIAVIASTIFDVNAASYIQVIIDGYIQPMLAEGSVDFTGLHSVLVRMGLNYLGAAVCAFVYCRVMVVVSQKCLKTIRDDMFTHMQSLPVRYFDTHTHGDIMSHYTSDTDTLRQFISSAIMDFISCAFTVVYSFVTMVRYNLLLAVIVAVSTLLLFVLVRYLTGRSTDAFRKLQISMGALNGYVEETMSGQKVVKVFNHEQAAEEDFRKYNSKLYEVGRTANTYGNVLMPVMTQSGNLIYIIVAFVGGYMAVTGRLGMTAGIVVVFLSLVKKFTNPLRECANQMNLISMALAGAERIFSLIDEKPEDDDGYVTLVRAKEVDGVITETDEKTEMWAWKHYHKADGTTTYAKLQGDIRMFNVDFGYNPDKTVLHDITLYGEPGQKIAFVGSTGAGKTTITNLINRFYDIEDGKIRYDGININKIKKSDLRQSLGLVLQDTFLFTGTVMDNIRYGRLDATDEECIEAAKLANADSFIRRLPDGYDTMLFGAGAGLSQGQRQLIAIARAAVADPPVMILDEATSSIDTRTEKYVQDGMDKLMKGRTTFVIAHRLSTIMNSDVIMVLDHGRIIERGTHESLLAKKGTYYQLYTGAFELD